MKSHNLSYLLQNTQQQTKFNIKQESKWKITKENNPQSETAVFALYAWRAIYSWYV